MNHLARLGLPDTATPAEVEARWKQLRSTHHPDHGGDATEFHELKQAYEGAISEVSQPRVCLSCNGTGKAEVRRGFSRVELMCPICNGLGVQE